MNIIETIATELLIEIAEQLGPQDLTSLCTTSKLLNSVATQVLYRHLIIRPNPMSPDISVAISPELLRSSSSSSPKNLLQHTKHLEMASTALSSGDNKHTCFIHEKPNSRPSRHFARDFIALLQSCRDGTLDSFSWTAGTCIPNGLLARLGKSHPALKSLTLVTVRACNRWGRRQLLDGKDFALFKHLQEFSWTGSLFPYERHGLLVAIDILSHQLVELHLDLCTSSREEHYMLQPLASFRGDFEGIPQVFDHIQQRFSVIKVLSLADVNLGPRPKSTAQGINFSSLKKLKLHYCDNWEDSLYEASLMSDGLHLQTLEIHSETDGSFGALPNILQSFQGVKQLYLWLGPYASIKKIWTSVMNHSSTLKALVYHQWDVDLKGRKRDKSEPLVTIASITYEDEPPIPPEIEDIECLESGPLEFLGLCCRPSILKHYLPNMLSPCIPLRVLHIRRSAYDFPHGPSWGMVLESYRGENTEQTPLSVNGYGNTMLTKDLKDLAQRAFGPNGIPSLQVIAYGDFSSNRKYKWTQVILVRVCDAWKLYRQLSASDHQWQDLIDQYSCLLAPSLRGRCE